MNLIKYFFCIFILLSGTSYAQTDSLEVPMQSVLNAPPKYAMDTIESPAGKEIISSISALSDPFRSFEFLLSIAILIFGVIVIALEVYLASRKIIKPDQVYKCIVLTLVIITSILLVTAGYSNNQITGVLGILGSISGYVVGRMDFNAAKTNNATGKTNTDEKEN